MFNFKKFSDQTLLICNRCNYITNFQKITNSCPVCSYHLFKVADRGTAMPTMWDRDIKQNPYIPSQPGDGTGYWKSVRMRRWDEPTSPEGGKKERKGYPKGISGFEDREGKPSDGTEDTPNANKEVDRGGLALEQRDQNMSNKYPSPGLFSDDSEPLSSNRETFDDIAGRKYEPVGPHNMQQHPKKNNVDNFFRWINKNQRRSK